MSYAERHEVALITVDGAAIGYSPVVTGKIISISYVKTDFADGVDFTITSEATGQTIWAENDVNAAKTVAPRQPTHSTAGVASVYASGGAAVNDYIAVANDRVKFAVAQGGDAKTGKFILIVG
jgi:hypothetical protein